MLYLYITRELTPFVSRIMPIFVKDYTWMQTDKTLHIKIPLSPGFRQNVDLFTTESYIKAHFSPFLFEVFLLHEVDDTKSQCVIKEDVIVLNLVKKEEYQWECLEKELTKAEKLAMKEKLLQNCQEKAKQQAEDKRIKKSQLDRYTVQRAMDIESQQHDLMDARRDAERKKAMDALEGTRGDGENEVFDKHNLCGRNKSLGVKIVELPPDSEDDTKINSKVETRIKNISISKEKGKRVKSQYVERKKEEIEKRVMPKVRDSSELEVRHTTRFFPTPSRESTAEEEAAWLKNVTLARRATGFVSEDLRPEEQDPQWCKEKGDEFFRGGNYLGAISAYTHGITLSDKLASLYANRAAAHFALGNFNKCVQDSSTALDLMKPACEGNRRSRAKCIARRAASLARLGYLTKAIDEMKAAAKLLPEDEKIKADIYDMERAWEQNPDSD